MNRPLTINLVAAIALTCFQATRAAEKELVLYLPLDEGRGSMVFDGAGGIRQGMLLGNPQWVQGKFGKALRFGGSPGAVLQLPLAASWYNENLAGLTVSMWVKSLGKSSAIFFGAHQPAEGRLYLAVGQDGCWSMGIQDKPWGTGGQGKRLKADTGWHAVSMTLDGSKATLYVDGEPIVQKTYTEYAIAARPTVHGLLAGGLPAHCFDGAVDELAIYKGVLTKAEIHEAIGGIAKTALYQRKLDQNKEYLDSLEAIRPSLIAHWTFDERGNQQTLDAGKNALHGKLHDGDRVEGLLGLALRCRARFSPPAYVEVPSHQALGGWPAMTLEAWVKWDPRSANIATLASKGYQEQLALAMYRYSQHVYLSLTTDKGRLQTRTSAKLPVYQWAHLVLTWDSRTSKAIVYVNGKAQWTGRLAGSQIASCKAPLMVAGNAVKGEHELGPFAGLIDDLKIYNVALSPDSIAAGYARLAKLAEENSATKWVPTKPGLLPLPETCLDHKTKALTYPAYPWPATPKPRKILSAADFPSIQAAIDALPAGGGQVFVPAGIWEIKSPIVLRSAVTLMGAGESTVIVNKNQQGADAITVKETKPYRDPKYHPPGASGTHGIVISRLQVRGNPKSGHGIGLYKSDHFTVDTCWLHFNGQDGLHISYGVENDTVRGVVSKWNGRHGMYLEGCHDTLITASHFEENRVDGVHVQKDNIQADLVGCNVEDNGRFGVYNKGRWTQVVGCQSDGNQGGAFVFIGPESEYETTVSGCCGGTVRAVDAHHVTVTGSQVSVLLSGCHGCVIAGNRSGIVNLEFGCCFSTVGTNVAGRITLSEDCHDNAVGGNVCRHTLVGNPDRNLIKNNIVGRHTTAADPGKKPPGPK